MTLRSFILTIILLVFTGCTYVPQTTNTPNLNEPVTTLSSYDVSNTTEGAAQFGAIVKFGDLDYKGRPTFAHIRLSDAHEPGSNGIKRPDKIKTDPEGWRNYKVQKQWVYDRTHLVGWQFSGIQDDPRNLVIGTRYLNRGTNGNGTDAKNPDSMLYYEQQLDNWVALHPNYTLDLYVQPIYHGKEMVPRGIYMQWVGVDNNDNTIQIKLGGHSGPVGDGDVYGVVLLNESDAYTIDYTTGQVTPN